MPKKTDLPPVPSALADVAMVDAKTATSVGRMSVSWWLERVATGEAPQPVIRAPRCTRWLMADVRRFWVQFAECSATNDRNAEQVTAQAKKASAAAKVKRLAVQSGAPQ